MYYSAIPILKRAKEKKSPVVIIYGGKGNGKTFNILQLGLTEFLKSGRPIRYLRRYKESTTSTALQSLFNPQKQNLINLTKGEYNSFTYFRSRFYITRVNENGDIVKKNKNPICIVSSLNSVESFTGADEGDCSMIFFDEFISREKSLADEFQTLMIFHDNCIRNRTNVYTPMILVGNTMSKNSTLARDFMVDLYKIKKGEIVEFYNKKGEILSIVEYCGVTEGMVKAGKTFYQRYDDDKVKMMYTGDWTVGNYPRIKLRYINNSTILFTFLIKTPAENNIILTLRVYKNFLFGFVDYALKDEKYDVLLTTDTTPLQNNIFNYFTPKIKIFKQLGYLILRNQIFFKDGEAGELFRNFLLSFRGCENFRSVYK